LGNGEGIWAMQQRISSKAEDYYDKAEAIYEEAETIYGKTEGAYYSS
jgi:hypothetical protein